MLNKIIQMSEKFNKRLNEIYGGYSWRGTDCTIFNKVFMVSAWFDDHDDDIFINYVIPNECLKDDVKKEIFDFCDDIMTTDKNFDMEELNSIFEKYILLVN